MNANCLKCGKILDSFTELSPGTLPKDGDISVCLYCASVASFTGNSLELRPMTEEELKAAMKQPKVKLAITLIRMHNALR